MAKKRLKSSPANELHGSLKTAEKRVIDGKEYWKVLIIKISPSKAYNLQHVQWKFTTTVSKLDFLSHAPVSPRKKFFMMFKKCFMFFLSPREAAEKFNEMKINLPRIFFPARNCYSRECEDRAIQLPRERNAIA